MATVEIKTKVTFQDLLSGVEQLSKKDLEQFLENVLKIRAKKNTSVLSKKETELLKKINVSIPEETRKRFEVLKEKRELGTLTESENQEAVKIIDLMEIQQVERLTALLELSKLKNIPFRELGLKLGIFPNMQNDEANG